MSALWHSIGAWVEFGAFALVSLCCGLLVLVGIPGIWVMVLLAAAIDAAHVVLAPSGEPFFGLWALVIAAIIALAAEGVEFVAGAAGAKAGGSSVRGMVGALVGSIAGAIVGSLILPLVGTLVGAVAGAAIGALAGELTVKGRGVSGSLAPALGAAAGRLAGFLAKLPFALAAWVVLLAGALWRML